MNDLSLVLVFAVVVFWMVYFVSYCVSLLAKGEKEKAKDFSGAVFVICLINFFLVTGFCFISALLSL